MVLVLNLGFASVYLSCCGLVAESFHFSFLIYKRKKTRSVSCVELFGGKMSHLGKCLVETLTHTRSSINTITTVIVIIIPVDLIKIIKHLVCAMGTTVLLNFLIKGKG